MKKKQKKELFSKTIPELSLLLKETREKLFSFKMDHTRKKLKNTRSIFMTRKEVARILTILKEKEFQKEKEEAKKV